ncbi:TetR/AcrR family transcriptional regulator [Flavobacterium sp. YJ01]|uniref:TetR/AcrR family transcriptional regulator n=1 Tax=unclassified Flavobacterium TaxID=196869 RepID=UPI0015BF1981|nr:TetR family transcriptional regulator [Flavobacterium sp. YJ01]NWL01807.1 hypothetical protein [Flavobacterium collinsii]WET02947.1 TetR family transcriptional regulator [Flavobacterium sp. YJ01]
MEKDNITAIKKVLLETAESLFSDRGYSDTSIRDIAKAAGVNLALVNYHFGSKENLYLTIFKRRFSAYELALTKMDNSKPADKKLDAFLEIYGSYIDSHRSFHRLLSREITLLHHDSIKEVITQATRKKYELIKTIILEGMAEGLFKTVNVDVVTLNIIAFVPRIFSGSPFITDLLDWQESELRDKQTVYTELKDYFYTILRNG